MVTNEINCRYIQQAFCPLEDQATGKRFKKWEERIYPAGGLAYSVCFGEDENGEYMDYYAAHRMTDDSHVRIYADGKEKALPTLNGRVLCSEDPVKAKRLEEEHDARNREVVEMLVEKGFTKFTINMCLSAGLDKKTKK